ncbi:glycerophosphodiester phosphodiesterase [Halorubrum sp. DTA98]|uniref:glycerophosphodiester phosphodiesterase n=1 Tax=Halorubrum sp. DTA98 TaxID=3402163 RepID=UPI003AAE15E7
MTGERGTETGHADETVGHADPPLDDDPTTTRPRSDDPTTTRPYAIGHRGCLAGVPENTIRAVTAAAPHVAAVEIDVRRCGSGEIVVAHDPTLDRICGVDGRVNDCSLDELQRHGVGDTDEPIPTLRALLDALPNRVDVNVEAKTDGIAADVADAIRAADNDAFVSSFSARALAEFREVAPDVRRGLLYKRSWRRALAAAERLDCDLLHPHAEIVDRTHLRAAEADGFQVNAWGVGDRETYARLADLGIDGTIVDDYRIVRGADGPDVVASD